MGGEETKEGIEERRFAREVLEAEPCPLSEHRVKAWCGSSVEEFQVIKSHHHTQYFRDVKFLLRTQPIEGQGKRGDEVNIVDRIL